MQTSLGTDANIYYKAPSRLFCKRVGDRFVAIDQKTFKWAVLNKLAWQHLKFLSSGHNLRQALINEITKKEIDEFCNAGLLVNDKKENLESNFIIPANNTGLKLIILHVSNACNMRCTYCYSNATNGKPMEIKVAVTAIDKLCLSFHKKICLEFHGGEPLLHFDFLKEVVTYANTKKLDNGESFFNYNIQTNATLLDDDKAQFLKDNKFEVGISIDGFKEQNDRNRVFKNGMGTYDSIISGIKVLIKHGIEFGALMTISNLSMIDKVYDFMLDTGISNLKLGEYFKQGRAKNSIRINMKEYAYKTLELIDKLVVHNLNNKKPLKLANASILLLNILTNQRKYMCRRFPCGAGDTVLGIDVDGSVYPCEEMNGKSRLITGNIVTDTLKQIIDSALNVKLRTRRIENYPICAECPVVSACEVTCPNQSYNKSRGFTCRSIKCDYYRVIIPELMLRLTDNPVGIKTLI